MVAKENVKKRKTVLTKAGMSVTIKLHREKRRGFFYQP